MSSELWKLYLKQFFFVNRLVDCSPRLHYKHIPHVHHTILKDLPCPARRKSQGIKPLPVPRSCLKTQMRVCCKSLFTSSAVFCVTALSGGHQRRLVIRLPMHDLDAAHAVQAFRQRSALIVVSYSSSKNSPSPTHDNLLH